MIKLKIHSLVDVITNSSTTIYTYQAGSISPVKELVQEILTISKITDKSPDDIFYYGVFCEDGIYFDKFDEGEEEAPLSMPELIGDWGTDERVNSQDAQQKWLDDLKTSIMKGEIEKPKWMIDIEEDENYSGYSIPTELCLVPKDDIYKPLANKLFSFLNSPNHEAFRDG